MGLFGGLNGVEINTKHGKRLCVVKPYVSTLSYKWVATAYGGDVSFDNPSAVEKYAWLQSFAIWQQIYKDEKLIKGKKDTLLKDWDRTFTCLICGEGSIVPRIFYAINKASVEGFECLNSECPMLKVLLPITIILHISEMPPDIHKI
jgi:hypothetical protein